MFRTRFNLAEILVLAGAAGAGWHRQPVLGSPLAETCPDAQFTVNRVTHTTRTRESPVRSAHPSLLAPHPAFQLLRRWLLAHPDSRCLSKTRGSGPYRRLSISLFTRGHDYAVRVHARVNCVPEHVSLAEILVLAGGAILPAPAVPASTGMSARLKSVQGHV